jgi:hypothetical protein
VKMFSAERELTLLCVVGIEDPLRPTVIDAIDRCNSAGVDVRMCTGDALATAVAISRQCNILRTRDMQVDKNGRQVPKPNFAMTGAEFDERVHFVDSSKPKVKRRAYIHATQVSQSYIYMYIYIEREKCTYMSAMLGRGWWYI